MNIRNVLKVYSLQRQFTDDESALLATLRELSDTERELLVESLQPQKAAVKKRKPRGGGKSQRAASLAEHLKTTMGKPQLCAFTMDNGDACRGPEDDAIHDPGAGYAGYHVFQPAKAAASAGD